MAEMFIGGGVVPFEGLDRLPVIDPATRRDVGDIPLADAVAVAEAVAAAEAAAPSWRARSAAVRGDVLHKAAANVYANLGELAAMLTQEQGKPLREAKMEIARFVSTLEHYAGLSKNIRGGSVPDLDEGTHGLILRRPVGVVGAIVPWNFPVSLLGNKLGPALVAGNTVVAKPAETTPLTTLRVASLMSDGGLPPGTFNVVTGQGRVAGEALVCHPAVRKVAFTGSTATGRRIMTLASAELKRLTLELGGSDAMIVCDDADVDAAVSAASVGRFFNCGQACLAIKRVYVFGSVAESFVEGLLAKIARLQMGPGTAEGVLVGPMHTQSGRSLLAEQVEEAAASGGKLLVGGKVPSGDPYDAGFFYEPTLLLDPPHEARVAREEVFGPALPVWRVADLDEAISRANDSPYGLGSSIWTRDLDRASRAADELEAGYTWVNSIQKIYDELPFGGIKQSGFGKEHGIEAIEQYTETKSVVIKRGG